MARAKHPGDYFFWGRWQSATDLKMCSHAAKGVWMDMLCIAGLSNRKGYVLIGGIAPSIEELAQAIGGTAESVGAAIAELEKWQVFSRDRNGVIYCRYMVQEEKNRRGSAKGGKIGGRITYENKRGIFAAQGDTQDMAQKVAQTPTPTQPNPQRKNGVNSRLNGNGVGTGSVTIKDPLERIDRFAKSLVPKLPSDRAWMLIAAAMDDQHPDFRLALDQCQKAARALGKGWPHNWPTDRRTH